MRKHLFYFISFLLFTSCRTVYSIYPFTHDYNENIYFKIDKVKEMNTITTGNGNYLPGKGKKFVIVFSTFINKTAEKQSLFLQNTYLLDGNGKKYMVEFLMNSGVPNPFSRLDSKIDPNETKNRNMVFTFPRTTRATRIVINCIETELKYKP